MPVARPKQYVAMQPRFRAPDERLRAQIQVAWSPGNDEYVLAVTVYSGEDDSELLSCVVAPPAGWLDVRTDIHSACFDVLELIRRSDDPFDDLL